ncbi:unnamed protein product [Mycena citricolor]|uniref:Uncharacterized protein n=1 Tax=Mycena citricolor TaxID=2018698 RepID=A0AAD2HWI8_9AGAR|nr:unnamed protein product [Mycena citricolor]
MQSILPLARSAARRSPARTAVQRFLSSSSAAAPQRTVIVTGAGRGIGKAIALRLARDGYDVTVNDLPSLQPSIDSVVSEIRGLGRAAHGFAADVTDAAAVDALVASSVEALGPLSTMISNAGIVQVKSLLDTSADDIRHMMNVNLVGVHNCHRSAARQILSQGTQGKLIAAASIAAFRAWSMLGPYAMSKFAVRALTQGWAVELAKRGITVNAYAPGIVDTDMWDVIDAKMREYEGDSAAKKGDAMRKTGRDLIALPRLSVPEDVANLVSFLASDGADYITGQTYIVDGGAYM